MIAVLVLSAFEAYRIQVSVSEQHLGIYRHFVEQDAELATLRRNLWQAGSDIRDFFIQSTPQQAASLRSQLEALEAEDNTALDRLAQSGIGADVVARLRRSLGEFWDVVRPVPQTMLSVDNRRQFDFLQREVVPRRGELYAALLPHAATDQQRLQESEGEFAAARRHAAQRLLMMLALGVLLGVMVARLSLRHAEHLEQKAELHYTEVEQARGELQRLSARLLEIEEEGRRQLSRELHDEIGQTLALLQIEISRVQAVLPAQPEAARERLRRARELAERRILFIRERDILAALSHPGHPAIPKISDFWEEPERLCIVLDLVEGETLIELLARRGRILRRCGFSVTHLEEWGPTDEQIAAHPEMAEERERPMFLLVAARHASSR